MSKKKTKQLEIKEKRFVSLSQQYKALITILKFLLYIILLFAFWYIFMYKRYIKIYITDNYEDSWEVGLFYGILVTLTLFLFITSCGVRMKYGRKMTILILIIILFLLLEGLFNIGFGVKFRKNFGLLEYNRYESDSIHGILFFVNNFFNFWLWIYLLCVALTGDDD